MKSRSVRVVFTLLLSSLTVRAQFYSLETKDLRLITYTQAHAFIVPHLAASFQNSLAFHKKLFDYTPSEKVTLILQDFGDYGSGGANTVPFNLLGIGIAPFNYSYETMPPLERMTMMMNHELAHIATMDKPSPSDRFFRSVFCGKPGPIAEAPPSMLYAYLTSPRWNSPRWFIEGIAVFLETWMGGGLGRAQGSYDEMVFRTMVRDSALFYDVVGLESEGTKVDFQVGANSYLYGTRFVSYLALQYGPDKLIDWFRQSKESKSNFSSEFERLYEASLDDEWSRWIQWEHAWQKVNLDSVKVNPATKFRPISHEGLGSVSRAFYDSSAGALYVAINYPGQTAHIAAIDVNSGALRKLQDIRGAALFYVTSLAYDPGSRTLFYTTDNNHERSIYAFDVTTGRSRMLLRKERVGDLAFNHKDKSLWGVRHLNGCSSIVRIPSPYVEANQVFLFDYPKDLYDIDISPDGTTLTGALALTDGTLLLIKMDTEKLRKGDGSYQVLFDFKEYSPANFVFSQDGKFLFGNSYYTGVSNIMRYDFDKNDMSPLTNAESGFFRPVPVSNDSLVSFHFTGRGFEPVMIANKIVDFHDRGAIRFLGTEVINRYPVLQTWQVDPKALRRINIDSLTTYKGTYSPAGNFRLASLYPVAEGYKVFPAYGVRFNFADPTTLTRGDLTIAYTPNQVLPHEERVHAAFNYRFWQWRIGGTYNASDFYDLFGPTKTSRKGYSLTVENRDFVLFDEPETMEYRVALGGYWRLERLPEFQNIQIPYDKFLSLNARINYQYLMKSLGAVDDERGVVWQLVSHTNLVNGKLFPRVHTNAAYGTLLPINHSSLWLRASAGYSFGDRQDPFSSFYFGGFGNNWVDHKEIKRYREEHSFPGVEIDNIGGVLFAKGMLEWDLPPIRFRRFGIPSFYCNWARVGLFASTIGTNFDRSSERQVVGNAGGQIDFRLVIFSSLESTLSLGYAVAARERQRLSNELMISLKIL